MGWKWGRKCLLTVSFIWFFRDAVFVYFWGHLDLEVLLVYRDSFLSLSSTSIITWDQPLRKFETFLEQLLVLGFTLLFFLMQNHVSFLVAIWCCFSQELGIDSFACVGLRCIHKCLSGIRIHEENIFGRFEIKLQFVRRFQFWRWWRIDLELLRDSAVLVTSWGGVALRYMLKQDDWAIHKFRYSASQVLIFALLVWWLGKMALIK